MKDKSIGALAAIFLSIFLAYSAAASDDAVYPKTMVAIERLGLEFPDDRLFVYPED